MHKEMRTRAYRFSGNTPAFPAQWFDDLYVLSLVTGLSCHHRQRDAQASSPTWRQRRGVRTTRLRRTHPCRTSCDTNASTAACPNVS